MFLKSLQLKNFRNYSDTKLEFGKNTVLIVGDNGQGKTNLLESIHYVSCGKSHRTNNQDELIGWGSEYSLIRAEMDGRLIELELDPGNKNKIRIDKAPYRKKSDFVSILPSVIFSPDDLVIVKGSPSARRNFLDDILEKIYPDYSALRLQYQKILNQRNSLIKSINSSGQFKDNLTVEVWDENLAKYGSEIISRRVDLLTGLKTGFPDMIKHFFPQSGADLFYVLSWDRNLSDANPGSGAGDMGTADKDDGNDASVEDKLLLDKKTIKELFRLKLKENFRRELAYKTTVTGPHRDDFMIILNGRDIRSFGSQGQQRIAAVCLKFCELEILKERLKKYPVLLLDDVLSELDQERENQVLNLIGGRFQTFITTSNINYINHISGIENTHIQKFFVKDNGISSISGSLA
ncbi:MAG: DNA replication/repair protein RecF [Actinobacteria bacterium]|nr:DNA replication/repair protein RecF [Actinomycetota bacterium]